MLWHSLPLILKTGWNRPDIIIITIIIIIIIIIIMIIIIHSKVQFEFFYNLLAAPQTVSNTYAQVAQSCENHVQHSGFISHATCCVPLGTKGQLSYSVWESWNRIYFSGTLWAETTNRWRLKEGRKLEHPEKALRDRLQKMPHTKARKFKPHLRLEPAI